ncbi:uncharacterized protein [Diadema antillarum]|uniref:uncharacterized protein n=1 Tax=Diadema antillarum TaxID=105358 RepID=UPI003A8649F3
MLPNMQTTYACSTCGKSFMRLAAKENHERIAHPADAAIIRASCQQRMSSSRKDKPKKSKRKDQGEEKGMTSSIKIKCQQHLKQASLVKDANCDNGIAQMSKPAENCGPSPMPMGIRATKSAHGSQLVKGLSCQELIDDGVRNVEKQPVQSNTGTTAVNEAGLPMTDVSNIVARHTIKVEEITSEDHHKQAICPHCQKVFKNDLYLNNHLLTHDELKQFDCYFCRLVFHSGASLKHHLEAVHNHLTEANCKRPYGDVIKTAVGLRFRCSMCPKTFTCRSNRKRHERWHFGIRPYSCEVCGVAFRQRWNLITHWKSKKCEKNRVTGVDEPKAKTPSYEETCNPGSECLKSQTTAPVMLRKIESEQFECSTSENPWEEEKQTSVSSSSNARPASAAVDKLGTSPSESFSTDTSQIVDLTLRHGEKFQIVNALPEENPLDLSKLTGLLMKKKTIKKNSTIFVCQICGKACKTNRNLVIHTRIHTGERPYSCTICGFTFRQSHHRKAHMLSKHGLFTPSPKPATKEEIVIVTKEGIRYQCHYCKKLLMSRSGRRKHERWHLGLRPHRCNTCGSTFKQRQHLKKHQRSTKCKPSQGLLRSQLVSVPCKENQGSHATITPLTPLHLVNQAKKAKTYQQELLDANDNLATLPVTNTPQLLDMPSALGLISTEKLKAISKEQSSDAENSTSRAEPGHTQSVEYSRIATAGNKTENVFPDEPRSTKVVEKYANRTDHTDEGSQEKRECLASSTLAEISELRPEKHMGVSDSAQCVGPIEEISDVEDGEVFDMTKLMTRYHSDSNEGDIIESSVSDENLRPLDFSCTSSVTQSNLQSKDGYNQASPVQCEVCGQFYKSKQNLAIHMRLHTGMQPFSCTHCPKSFIHPHPLEVHMKSKHNIFMTNMTKSSHAEEVIMTPEGPRYKCQHCPKLLASKNGRRKHERWHLGLRPYRCDVCGKAFKQSHHMKRHKGGKGCIQAVLNHWDPIT